MRNTSTTQTRTRTTSTGPKLGSGRTDVAPSADDEGKILDLVGVGFGPANLALAIALDESEAELQCRFFERRERFGWHPGMLLPGTTMQISFLKDLVTLRNPSSTYSFPAYLHAKGRLVDFVNRATLTPERVEFADYLAWAAERLSSVVQYGEQVIDISRGSGDARFVVTHRSPDGGVNRTFARTVVVASGLKPVLPNWAHDHLGERVFHNIDLVQRLESLDAGLPGGLAQARVLVVGGGQSAAEVALHVHDRAASLDIAFHGFGLADVDESPFVNQIFDPDVVDEFDAAPDAVREDLLRRHANANYSAVERALTDELYARWYREKITGERRLNVHRTCEVESITESDGGAVTVAFHRVTNGDRWTAEFDAIVCATGFEPGGFAELSGIGTHHGDVRTTRGHVAVIDGEEIDGLFVQGTDVRGHGIGATLLSMVAVRAGELVHSIERKVAS